MKSVFSLLLLLWIVSTEAKFVITDGKCPEAVAQYTLKVEDYVGVWYEYMRFPAVFEAGLECTSAVYTALPNNTIGVRNEGYLRARVFGRTYTIDRSVAQGIAVAPDPIKPAELSVSFPPVFSFDLINYKVLETDYTRHALIFSCQEFWNFNIQFAWILTRERGVAPPTIVMELWQRRLRTVGIDDSHFILVRQDDDCPEVESTVTPRETV